MITSPVPFVIAAALVTYGGVLSWVVYRSAPDSARSRRVALFVWWLSATIPLWSLVPLGLDSYRLAAASIATFQALAAFVPLLYLRVIATLETPWARPFASAWTQGLFAAIGVTGFVAVLAAGHGLDAQLVAFDLHRGGPWNGWPGRGLKPVFALTYAIPRFATLLVGLVLAIHTVLIATSRTERGRALVWAWAFGLYDVSVWLVVGTNTFLAEVPSWAAWISVPGVVALITLLAYGILRYQLFEIDLHIKRGISGTTVGAVIAGAAIVGSEVLEAMFGVDQVVPAIAIGALVALAFRPLGKVADHLADKAMPGVEDTPAYRQARAREIYAAAVESVMKGGAVTDKERSTLATLVEKLGLKPTEARAIERDLTAAGGGA